MKDKITLSITLQGTTVMLALAVMTLIFLLSISDNSDALVYISGDREAAAKAAGTPLSAAPMDPSILKNTLCANSHSADYKKLDQIRKHLTKLRAKKQTAKLQAKRRTLRQQFFDLIDKIKADGCPVSRKT